MKLFSRVQLFAIPWTIVYQASLSVGFSRQEYWSGCHFLLQGIFLTQRSSLSLLHCRQTLYPLSHQGSPSEERRTVIWEAEAWKCAWRKCDLCVCVETIVLKEKKKTEKFPFLVATFFFPQLQWQNNKQAAKKCVNILFCLVSWNSLNQFSSVQLSLSVMSDSLRPHESKHTINRVNYSIMIFAAMKLEDVFSLEGKVRRT